MKKSEKDALKKAFNIPEPKHKNSFVSSYNEMLKKNERKFNIPVFFRWTSTAVFAALIIGLWGNLSQNTDFRYKFTKDPSQIITETTTTSITTATEAHDINTIITSSAVPQTARTTQQTTLISQTTKKSESSVINISTSIASTSYTESKHNTVTEKTETSEVTEPAPAISTDEITTVRTTLTTTATANSPALNFTTTIKTTTKKPETTHTTTQKTTIITTTEFSEPAPDITTTTEFDESPAIAPSTTTKQSGLEVNVTTTKTPQPNNIDTPTSPSESVNNFVTTTRPNDNIHPLDPTVCGNNYIVTPSANYQKSYKTVSIEDIFEDSCTAYPEPNDNIITDKQLINNSDYIVMGEIDEIIYTEVNGMPYTQENITVYSVYKGNKLIYMDKISVYIKGGYMPIQEFADMHGIYNYYPDDYSVYDSGGNNGTQNVGDILLFCIKDGTSSMPDGAFMLTGQNDISVFRYENKEYISLGNDDLRFKINDLLNI